MRKHLWNDDGTRNNFDYHILDKLTGELKNCINKMLDDGCSWDMIFIILHETVTDEVLWHERKQHY